MKKVILATLIATSALQASDSEKVETFQSPDADKKTSWFSTIAEHHVQLSDVITFTRAIACHIACQSETGWAIADMTKYAYDELTQKLSTKPETDQKNSSPYVKAADEKAADELQTLEPVSPAKVEDQSNTVHGDIIEMVQDNDDSI